jgi:hypothetical protein
MSQNLYLKNYRLHREGDAPARPMVEVGAASTFKATDVRSGAPVLLTLIPVGAVTDEEREKFEANARLITQFEQEHVTRTVDFGRQEDEYAFISEYPRGETAEQWVKQYGRMPPEAVLRIAIQVVSAIGAAAFHKIVHGGIRPSNVVIIPGQTAEGGWPAIKLTNMAAACLGATSLSDPDSIQFASPEQLRDGTADFRSEIYSLGATMCFLLTGAFYSAEPRSLQTRRFARPLRKLIQPMLRQDPNERPQDPVVLREALRDCLEKVERREALAHRAGIPFLAVRAAAVRVKPPKRLPKQILAPIGDSAGGPEETPEEILPLPRRWSPVLAIAAALLLGLGIIGAAILPMRHLFFAHSGTGSIDKVGVPIGVSQPASVWEGKPLVMSKDRIKGVAASSPSVTPAVVTAPVSASGATEQTASTSASPARSSAVVAKNDDQEPPPPSDGPESVWEKAGNRPLNERVVTKDNAAGAPDASDNPETNEPQARSGDAAARETMSGDDSHAQTVTKRSPKLVDRSDANESARVHPGAPTNVRRTTRTATNHVASARIASDGSVILRFANGEVAVIPPPQDVIPRQRRHRRAYIEREPVVIPDRPPGYQYLPPD